MALGVTQRVVSASGVSAVLGRVDGAGSTQLTVRPRCYCSLTCSTRRAATLFGAL